MLSWVFIDVVEGEDVHQDFVEGLGKAPVANCSVAASAQRLCNRCIRLMYT
jgi:hypothetical protein